MPAVEMLPVAPAALSPVAEPAFLPVAPLAVAEAPAAPGPPIAFAAPAVVPAPPPVAAPAPAPVAISAPAPAPDTSMAAVLNAQYLQHQLALAELRNQHLLEQQQMLREMLAMARQAMA